MPTPYFALYPTDFLANVGHLGNTELGVYWRLLLVYYRDGRPLPVDPDKLRRIAMTFSPEECRTLDSVVSEFFVLSTEPDGTRVWRHKRADRELAEASDRRSRAVTKAEAAAKARWSKHAPSNASSMPQAMPEGCQPEPEPEPEPEEKKEGEKSPRKRSATPLPSAVDLYTQKVDNEPVKTKQPTRPDDVDPQTWDDWLQLRKAKKAPVTQTVINGAIKEAGKAGMTLTDFLAIWCRRGSQGLEASWLKDSERSQGEHRETFRERDLRIAAERVRELTGGLCHDRRATGEAQRELLPFERGYVAPKDTIEGVAHESYRIAG